MLQLKVVGMLQNVERSVHISQAVCDAYCGQSNHSNAIGRTSNWGRWWNYILKYYFTHARCIVTYLFIAEQEHHSRCNQPAMHPSVQSLMSPGRHQPTKRRRQEKILHSKSLLTSFHPRRNRPIDWTMSLPFCAHSLPPLIARPVCAPLRIRITWHSPIQVGVCRLDIPYPIPVTTRHLRMRNHASETTAASALRAVLQPLYHCQ